MKKYSDSTLMRMTKAELIEQLRCAEHNQEVAEEQLAQQAENVKDWVPVVRCEDCIHYREYMRRDMCAKNATLLDGHEVGLRATGKGEFCSRGKRKEKP